MKPLVYAATRKARRLWMLCCMAGFNAFFSGPATAQTTVFPMPTAGCPMAHCDARMSDLVGTRVPASVAWTRTDTLAGAGGGLGCVSNLGRVACTYRSDPLAQSNLIVYDADGNRVWQDNGQLGSTAWLSAPIIGSDGSVIAADRNWVLRVDPDTDTVLWKSAKPDNGDPISPVLVGTDNSMVFVATSSNDTGGTPEVSVWDVTTGVMLARKALVDAATGRVYVTRNTVATKGNRAYVLTAAASDTTDGRLYAIDVCNAASCGVRGSLTVRWFYAFRGPSGSSPLRIGDVLYFDGRPSSSSATFMAVHDRGSFARRLWMRTFTGYFGVSAAQDPRGGLWTRLHGTGTPMRLNADTGATEQEVNFAAVLGLAGYVSHSVMSVSSTAAGAVALTVGVNKPMPNTQPSYVAALDVSSSPGGRLLWLRQVDSSALANTATGQFPIVVNAAGARRVVFTGTRSSTFFAGEP